LRSRARVKGDVFSESAKRVTSVAQHVTGAPDKRGCALVGVVECWDNGYLSRESVRTAQNPVTTTPPVSQRETADHSPAFQRWVAVYKRSESL
jgi:hypothetical protein